MTTWRLGLFGLITRQSAPTHYPRLAVISESSPKPKSEPRFPDAAALYLVLGFLPPSQSVSSWGQRPMLRGHSAPMAAEASLPQSHISRCPAAAQLSVLPWPQHFNLGLEPPLKVMPKCGCVHRCSCAIYPKGVSQLSWSPQGAQHPKVSELLLCPPVTCLIS